MGKVFGLVCVLGLLWGLGIEVMTDWSTSTAFLISVGVGSVVIYPVSIVVGIYRGWV